jgi:Domain of unknown function (DUF4129)
MMPPYAALAMAITAAVSSAQLPPPDSIRDAAKTVLARPDFQANGSSEAAEGLWGYLHRLLIEAMHAIQDFFRWLYLMSPILAYLFIAVLSISAALLIGHIVWTIVMVIRGGRRQALLDDALSSRRTDPAELAAEAERARREEDYILGVRLLFRACLTLLEEREGKKFRPGATNREHLARYRQTPVYDWLSRFVWVIDSKWYGSEACLPADFAACHEAYLKISSLNADRADAQHA